MGVIVLGYRNCKKYRTMKLENVDFNNKVEQLRDEAARKISTEPELLQLVYCGTQLDLNESLSDAGLISGAVVHCLIKCDNPTTVPSPLSLIEIPQLLVNLRQIASHSSFRNFVPQKLQSPDVVQKVLLDCPYVQHDPSSLAFLQDPDLFISLTNADELNRTVEKNPAVGRVAEFVANLIRNELPSHGRSHHISYSLDTLSDEEEMDIEQPGDLSRAAGPSCQVITPAQLAAALASATGSQYGLENTSRLNRSPYNLSTPASTGPTTTATPYNTPVPPTAGGTHSPGPITTEMFSQALQNALAASTGGGISSIDSHVGGTPVLSSSPSTIAVPNLEESLLLMSEMGISDTELSRQALQVTNGDVQAAVNLIFSQMMLDE